MHTQQMLYYWATSIALATAILIDIALTHEISLENMTSLGYESSPHSISFPWFVIVICIILAIIVCEKRYLIGNLICISVMTNDIEHFSVWLLATEFFRGVLLHWKSVLDHFSCKCILNSDGVKALVIV